MLIKGFRTTESLFNNQPRAFCLKVDGKDAYLG